MNLLINGYIDLCGGCPDNDDTCATILLLETTDVRTDLLHHVPAIAALLHVFTIQTFCVVVVEGSLHRHDTFQLLFHGVDILLFQNLAVDR